MHDKKLKILKNISDDLIDACAAIRYNYYLRKGGAKTKRFGKAGWISTLAATLCLVIGASVVFLIWNNNKNIPVYTGMTLSSENEQGEVALSGNKLGISLLAAGDETDDKDVKDSIKAKYEEKYANEVSKGNDTELFYAKPNEDFYITVHVSNPNNYEILSFTLNGVKYSSYMFETGSDMENLILKCNVGDAEGLVEYTIDAIKYVDGEKIKDVRMQGERTVEIGVYTENQPTATVENILVDFNSVTCTVTAHDPFGLRGLLGGNFYAAIYDGDDLLYRQEIFKEMPSTIKFDGLISNTEYRVCVIGFYDALDGEGKAVHILAAESAATPLVFAFSDMKIGDTSVSFTPSWAKDYVGKKVITSMELYDGDKLISKLSSSATKVTGLLSGHTYKLIARFESEGHEDKTEQMFTTATNTVPKLTISPTDWSFEHIEFSINIADKNSVGKLTSLELLDNSGKLVKKLNTDTRRVDGLDKLKLYTVKATYTYDLRDGTGSHTVVSEGKIATQTSGLKISNGEIVGIGDCKESKLYIAMNIAANAFYGGNIIDYVYLAENVTSINGAFEYYELDYILICCEFSERDIGVDPDRLIFDVKECRTDSQGVTYAVQHNGNIVAADYDGSTPDIVLPNGVTEIGPKAFSENAALKSITIPEGVTSIGYFAFGNAKALETVIMPNTVKKIGDSAFWYCTALKTINLNDGITEIGESAFDSCCSLTEIHIPKGITKIETATFEYCHTLTEPVIPDSVEEIDEKAFESCYSLKKVYIPASVVKMGGYAFDVVLYGNENTVIYCEANARPSGWAKDWCNSSIKVVWGATMEQYLAYDPANPTE